MSELAVGGFSLTQPNPPVIKSRKHQRWLNNCYRSAWIIWFRTQCRMFIYSSHKIQNRLQIWTQPHLQKIWKKNHPTQPNPWMDRAHGQLWSMLLLQYSTRSVCNLKMNNFTDLRSTDVARSSISENDDNVRYVTAVTCRWSQHRSTNIGKSISRVGETSWVS